MAKNNKVIKKQIKQYQHLLECYEEMNSDYCRQGTIVPIQTNFCSTS